ncbi:hypothetical protein PRCB_02430 [Pantoea rodasii]|uniref:Uncharacterized protein n=1 Tax=Pantoea rodasii TaxID=1076549 RepID=A0A2M9WI08_9GAMM|nr:CfaE/CblD family pilus tip adhesin [Pantoea rodasii]ORM59450.1 hypothetical protein HA45_22650 [Pantoea rodasii]PJZ07139.1 hypothetical protein PRCB_02430 [Pantoea rodasii]
MKRLLQVSLAVMALLSVSPGCRAEYAPPVSLNTPVNATFDRSAIPSSVMIWNAVSGGRDDEKPTGTKGTWSTNILTCLSDSDPANGACPTTMGAWGQPDGDGAIKLRFTQDNTGTTVDINVQAYHVVSFPSGGTDSHKAPWNPIGFVNATYTLFTYIINQNELARLNNGGIWRATLKQNLYQRDPGISLANWTADIVLHVTDNQNQQIYFPAYGTKSPTVNIPLYINGESTHTAPGTSSSHSTRRPNFFRTGKVTVDMCLYDGSNSDSKSMTLIFRDGSGEFPGSTTKTELSKTFHMFRNGTAGSGRSYIGYEIKILNPVTGEYQQVNHLGASGAAINWSGLNNPDLLKKVSIPGVQGVSLCVPSKLEFYVPPVIANAGAYSNLLRLTYTPST